MLTALRVRATLLADRLDWEGFHEWLATEIQNGLVLMHEAMAKGHAASGTLTVEQTLQLNEIFHTWVAGFTRNLRLCRRVGPAEVPLARLTDIARAQATTVAARNGWPPPPESVPGLVELEDDDV